VATGEALAPVRGDVPTDGRCVRLSFDDGPIRVLRRAPPTPAETDAPAVVFVDPVMVGASEGADRDAWREAASHADHVGVPDRDRLRRLAGAGFDVGTHGRTQARMSMIGGCPMYLRNDVAGRETELGAVPGRPCRRCAKPCRTLADIGVEIASAVRRASHEASSFGAARKAITPGVTDLLAVPRRHFEPRWPAAHVSFFARGGIKRPAAPPTG